MSLIHLLFSLILQDLPLVASKVVWSGHWGPRCDFLGRPFASTKVEGMFCGNSCMAVPDCTHYTITQGDENDETCWFWNGLVLQSDAFDNGNHKTFCGYLPVSWHKTNTDYYKDWAISCQFKHQEFKREFLGLEDCIRTCQSLSKCTHFNWESDISNNNMDICKLIGGTVSKLEAYHTTNPNIVCGIKDNKTINPLDLPKIEYENQIENGISWTTKNWANGCKFNGKDILTLKLGIEECRINCSVTPECTHYNWNPDISGKTGNCQMMTGNVHKADAHLTSVNTSICGLIPVSWHGNSWAISCSFEGNDLSQVVKASDFCTEECDSTHGCTHFTWNLTDGGTCFLKEGNVRKSDAYFVNNHLSICGLCETCLGSVPMSKNDVIIVTLTTLLVITVGISLLLHFFRSEFWRFKYHLAKYRLGRNKSELSKSFEFDAFVSYSSSDEAWILNMLVENLENSNNLKLCLHERDFQIGRPIADNIVCSLEKSASCILVLTEMFTKSYWCNFEAQVAHHMFQEQGRVKNLIVVVLEESVSALNLSKTLKYVLKTQTYLEWKETNEDNFWLRLKNTLQQNSLFWNESETSI